ncbi:hypothetical protein AB0L57_21610 [Nocardia sp. NPDC052254]|uniref:hypothetical protein n=1 Tax=Nocardia sp. NPDC052254 TaxID=3155681 RepID=UPI00343139F1
MRTTADPAMRLRGSCVAAASATVSVAAHALAGGTASPGSAAIMLLVASSAVIGCLAAHSRTGTVRLMGLLAVGQLSGHIALSSVSHCHTAMFTTSMLIAHAVAIAAGALLIRGSEMTLLRVVSRIRRVVRQLSPVPGFTTPPVFASFPEVSVSRYRLVAASGTGRRGPPSGRGLFLEPSRA